jgi:hypothetical protein
MDGAYSTYGEGRVVYKVYLGKPEVKRPLARSRLRWEDNIKMDLHELECEDMDWIHLSQNALMNIRVP